MAALAIPSVRGGWWHQYVCPTHGVELDARRDDCFPCRYGCRLAGEPYAGAWAALAHQAAALDLRRHAVCGDTAVVLAGLDQYVDLYAGLGGQHEGAQPWMLPGRLFHQALSEAIWVTSVARAVRTIAGAVPARRLARVAGMLRGVRAAAEASRETLVGRGDLAHNYTAWLGAAGATCSRALARLGEPDRTGDWLRGLDEHAAAAIAPDGWEWEGSAYYHAFVLRAYLLATRDVPVDALPADLLAAMTRMTRVVADFATDDGRLPAVHDTPYASRRWDAELLELGLLAARLPDGPALGHLVGPLSERLPAEEVAWRRADAGDPVVSTSDTPRGNTVWPDAGYAVLAGAGARAVVDFGPHGGPHGHLDKLALYLYGPTALWQPALGVPPYAHPWRKSVYAATAAHPTLTVDGVDQREGSGELLYWRDSGALGVATDVHDGVRFERHVLATAGRIVDVVWARSQTERRLTLHLRTDVDVRVSAVDGGWRTTWPGDDGLTGRHAAGGESTLSTVPDLGPGDDPQRSRPHLRWETTGSEAVFLSVYTADGADQPVAVGPGPTVHIGSTTYEVPFHAAR